MTCSQANGCCSMAACKCNRNVAHALQAAAPQEASQLCKTRRLYRHRTSQLEGMCRRSQHILCASCSTPLPDAQLSSWQRLKSGCGVTCSSLQCRCCAEPLMGSLDASQDRVLAGIGCFHFTAATGHHALAFNAEVIIAAEVLIASRGCPRNTILPVVRLLTNHGASI